MKLRKIAALVAGIALLSSCEYQKYNRVEQDDVREGSEYVYGPHPDSAARQLANKYEDNPEMDRRANAIREKLFGNTDGTPGSTVESATAAQQDTTGATGTQAR
ncbi:hypothetical protein [Telluribacter sp. SYSU D00476]|uniref:hypothetical protein n=1 Tax=Telluribacter sp. SYSU D00476 TaxID=2811430 RepID=UPI001FF50F9C|nr:hypothetical protein [Telluribacter sp. SYSU D00476]